MNIAFDAKRAFTNGTGLGHYSRTLIRSLATYFPNESYFPCTPLITDRFDTSAFKNIQIITPTTLATRSFRKLWRSSLVKSDLLKNKIDLYHGLSHEIPKDIDKTKIKSVVTIHDLIFERFPEQYPLIDRKIYRFKFQYACRHADKIIAISQQTKQDLIELYNIPEEKIAVCYQSCDERFFNDVNEMEKKRIRELYDLPDLFFLYTGSIIDRKNLMLICQAMTKIKNKIPLVVIGDGGSYKQQVKNFLKTNQLERFVLFLSEREKTAHLPGYVLATDFPAIYQQALGMIYPSVFEGFGIPVLEALCSHIPVITSNISSLPEAGGEGAVYISPNDSEALATQMEEIISNKDLRQSLIQKGWNHAQQFTREKCAQAVMEEYKKTLAC
ncbi:MAG: glycosyltransferase family 4 protein [Bacteroidetes bacterium]|nr:glycosyltransferase family 4 protein [Bacteroidota bacterium]